MSALDSRMGVWVSKNLVASDNNRVRHTAELTVSVILVRHCNCLKIDIIISTHYNHNNCYIYSEGRSVGARVQFQAHLHHDIDSEVPLDQGQSPRHVEDIIVGVSDGVNVRKFSRKSHLFQEIEDRFVLQIV